MPLLNNTISCTITGPQHAQNTFQGWINLARSVIGEVGGGGRFFRPPLEIFTARAGAAEDSGVLGIALALLSIANARPSLRDLGTGTIPVQCLVALRGTEGSFAHPSGEEGEPANRKQDNTRLVHARNPKSCVTL